MIDGLQLLLHNLNPSLSCISITRATVDFMHMNIDMSVSQSQT